MPRETFTYHRAELYEEVWAEPVSAVAKRYNISDVALAKVCRKLGVPLPGRGFWARKRAGQKLKRPALPALKKGQSEAVTSDRWIEPERPRPALSPETEAMIAKEAAPDAVIKVGDALNEPHKLVAMSAKLLQRAKPFAGVVRCRDRRCLDVSVSPAALDRALRLMDALLKAIDARGLVLQVTEPRTEELRRGYAQPPADETPSNVTRVKVAGEWIQFSLAEKIAQKRPPAPPAPKHMRDAEADFWRIMHRPPLEYVPTGIFTLAIVGRHVWRDGKRRRVEDCLNEFVASLYETAEAIKAERVEQARREQEWKREQERRWQEERRRQEEAKRAKELEEVVGQWRFAHDIRAYVAEARKMVADAGVTMAEGSPLDEWLCFAARYAAQVDPLAGLRADIARVRAEKEPAPADPTPVEGASDAPVEPRSS